MKRKLITLSFFVSALLITVSPVFGQDTLFVEDFEVGSPVVTLNTTDMGGSPTSVNKWIINNSYTGGSGSLMCLGFPFAYTIVSTATQPAGITGYPTSTYLHTISDYGIADMIYCSSYAAADGICIFNDYPFTRMSTDVNTAGYDSVSFSFWWICGGGSATHGEVYYSTDGGSSWTMITTPISQYKLQTSWTQQTISLPAFAGQPTLRFGFRFVNGTSSSALDPGFSIDDIVISGMSLLETGTVSAGPHCPGDTLSVPYTANTTFNPGNVFSAELSSASGSFSSPTVIGSVSATGPGSGVIACTIPPGTAAGTGYRIRVISSGPAIQSLDNGMDITINLGPDASTMTATADTICEGDSVNISLMGTVAGTEAWGISTDGVSYSSISTPATPFNSGALIQDTWYRMIASNSCGNDTTETKVTVLSAPVADFVYSIGGTGLDITFSSTSTGATSYEWDFGDGASSVNALDTHTYAATGIYIVTLIVSNGYCFDTIVDTLNLDPLGITGGPTRASVRIYPNPSNGNFTIEWEGDMQRISLLDLTGRVMLDEQRLGGSASLNVNIPETFANGIYYLKLETDDGELIRKLLLQR